MPSASAPTGTGCVPPQDPPSRSGIWRPSQRSTNSALRSSDRPTSGQTASVWPGHLTARHSSLDTQTISSESGRSPSRAAHNHELRVISLSKSWSGTELVNTRAPTRCNFNYILNKFFVPWGHILARISQKMHSRTIYISSSDYFFLLPSSSTKQRKCPVTRIFHPSFAFSHDVMLCCTSLKRRVRTPNLNYV